VKFALGCSSIRMWMGGAKLVFFLPESLETVAEHSFVLLKNASGGANRFCPFRANAWLGVGGVRPLWAGPIPMIASQAVLPSTRCLCGLLKPSLPKIPPVTRSIGQSLDPS
jgi:hypothetical protein